MLHQSQNLSLQTRKISQEKAGERRIFLTSSFYPWQCQSWNNYLEIRVEACWKGSLNQGRMMESLTRKVTSLGWEICSTFVIWGKQRGRRLERYFPLTVGIMTRLSLSLQIVTKIMALEDGNCRCKLNIRISSWKQSFLPYNRQGDFNGIGEPKGLRVSLM